MGKIFKSKKLTTFAESLILALIVGVVLTGVYIVAPGLRVNESVLGNALTGDNQLIDNLTQEKMLPLPTKQVSTSIGTKPFVRIAGYAWNGQSSLIVANGGPRTTKGSLMEANGVNLNIVRQDWLSELRNMQLKFIDEFNNGNPYPNSDKSAMGVVIMGDGAPFYISTTQKTLDEKYGKDKYHLQVVGAFAASHGEDKLIGPEEWKTNPKSMLGSLISVVIGDGDWVTVLNYCFANGLKVNPDFTTYDADAVNLYPSQDDDYIKSAEELIKSQKSGFVVELDIVKNGKKTGQKIKKTIDGCGTWTPGDKMVFDALSGFTDVASTKDFVNQMPTTLIVVKQWAEKNPDIVSNILKSALTASNQIKLYDQWRVRASEAVAETFNLESPKYWYDMYKGQEGVKNGIRYSVGGTRAMNYADILQYYGIGGDGVSRYKSVYEQVSNYLLDMNPFDFKSEVNRVIPYSEAVNLRYLKLIDNIESGVADKSDYTKEATNVMASGEWRFQFAVGSDRIEQVSAKELEKLYNLLVQAESTRLIIEGHTDNTGNHDLNVNLSRQRAQSVVNYLVNRGIPQARIQDVVGFGPDKPIATNDTSDGRALNRRVQVTLVN
jgi:OmpA-OmpF porin, OOP family